MHYIDLHIWVSITVLFFSTYLFWPRNVTSPKVYIRFVLASASLAASIITLSSYIDMLRLMLSLMAMVIVYPSLITGSKVVISRLTYRVDAVSFILSAQALYWLASFRNLRAEDVDMSIVVFSLVSIGSASLGIVLLFTLALKLRSYRFKPVAERQKQPTVTLAIPARNETHALTASLQAAVASDYKKLEILVLDDCSQDSTANIIKSFAHDGVRFVQGKPPTQTWLGKNHAYQTLLEHASGEYVLFAGVDVHFDPRAIHQLVGRVVADELEVASVLPRRNNLDLLATMLQSLRYLRILVSSESSVSSVWIAKRSFLKKHGSFKAVQNSIVPERYFAKRGKYGFFVANSHLGISTRKKISSQFETATRMLFPYLGRSIFMVYVVWVSVVSFLLMPYVVAWLELFGKGAVTYSSALSLAPAAMLTIVHTWVLFIMHPRSWLMGLISFPFAVVTELLALIWSLVAYMIGRTKWKGRNICLPVLSSIPRLPKV